MSPRRRPSARQAGDAALLSGWSGIPIVVRVDQAAAVRLGVDVDDLALKVGRWLVDGRLQVWGRHADGRPVYRLRELEALVAAGEVADAPAYAQP